MSENKKSVPEISIDSMTLYKRLIKMSPGEVIKYSDLNSLILRDVQKEAKGSLRTARRKALSDDKMVFDVIISVGIKRLADSEIVGLSSSSIEKIRRASKLASKKIMCVSDFDKLKTEDKIKHNTAISMFGVLAHMTTQRNIERIESKVSESNSMLPVMKTIEIFREKVS